jgi:hypothetical protein
LLAEAQASAAEIAAAAERADAGADAGGEGRNDVGGVDTTRNAPAKENEV